MSLRTDSSILKCSTLDDKWRTYLVQQIRRGGTSLLALLSELDESNRKIVVLTTCIKNRKSIAHYLAKYASEPVFTDIFKNTCIHEELLKLLQYRDIYGNLPIHYAVENKEAIAIVDIILKTFPNQKNEPGRKGRNLIQIAASKGKRDLFNYLKPITDDFQFDPDGNSIRHLISKGGNYEFFLEHSNLWEAGFGNKNAKELLPIYYEIRSKMAESNLGNLLCSGIEIEEYVRCAIKYHNYTAFNQMMPIAQSTQKDSYLSDWSILEIIIKYQASELLPNAWYNETNVLSEGVKKKIIQTVFLSHRDSSKDFIDKLFTKVQLEFEYLRRKKKWLKNIFSTGNKSLFEYLHAKYPISQLIKVINAGYIILAKNHHFEFLKYLMSVTNYDFKDLELNFALLNILVAYITDRELLSKLLVSITTGSLEGLLFQAAINANYPAFVVLFETWQSQHPQCNTKSIIEMERGGCNLSHAVSLGGNPFIAKLIFNVFESKYDRENFILQKNNGDQSNSLFYCILPFTRSEFSHSRQKFDCPQFLLLEACFNFYWGSIPFQEHKNCFGNLLHSICDIRDPYLFNIQERLFDTYASAKRAIESLIGKNNSGQTPWELLVNKNLAELIARYQPGVCAEKRYSIDQKNVLLGEPLNVKSNFGYVHDASYFGTPVIVKRILKENVRKAGKCATSLEEFFKEAGFLCQLSHPNIVRSMGLYVEEEYYAFILEKMECSLSRALVNTSTPPGQLKEAALQLSAIRTISIDICRALIYLHNYSPDYIIHNDIHAGNILLSSCKTHAKVSDFGISNFSRIPQKTRNVHLLVKGLNPVENEIFAFVFVILQMYVTWLPLFDLYVLETVAEYKDLQPVLNGNETGSVFLMLFHEILKKRNILSLLDILKKLEELDVEREQLILETIRAKYHKYEPFNVHQPAAPELIAGALGSYEVDLPDNSTEEITDPACSSGYLEI